MTQELYNQMNKQSLNMASALGHLRGVLIGEILYNDGISLPKFKHLYDALKHSHELCGVEMSEFDISRIKQRAHELGVTL